MSQRDPSVQCGRCHFYEANYEDQDFGTCFRYPPRPSPIMDHEERNEPDAYLFPVVVSDDWCGEFQPVTPPDDTPDNRNVSSLQMRLSDLPLWRLLVALDDAERTVGADSSTARTLARIIQERLRGQRDEGPVTPPADSPPPADASAPGD